MKLKILPSAINGSITAPPSKSLCQRAFAAALIHKGKSIIENAGRSDDEKAALQIIKSLGASVVEEDGRLIINSNGIAPLATEINAYESGLSVRMFTPIAAVSSKPLSIKGEGSLLKRPVDYFEKLLPLLDVQCNTTNGSLPIHLKGPLHPRDITVDGSLSSQFLTGLLFAYSAAHAKDVTITVNDLKSRAYVDLTLDVLSAFGLKIPSNDQYESFYFSLEEHEAKNDTITFKVENDWSGAAFLLVAGAINGEVEVTALDVFSKQADKSILQPLMQSQAAISIEPDRVTVKKSRLQPFHFNATDCPDLFPPLVALASACEGSSVIEGVHRLSAKESNRSEALVQEFRKLGIDIFLQDDLMVIKGGKITGAEVDAHGDHRIAMACTIAAMRGESESILTHAEAINKSYPEFYNHMISCGAALSLINS